MLPLRKEVQELIRAAEVMQAMMAQEKTLSEDELQLVELVAIDLLSSLRPRKARSVEPGADSHAGRRPENSAHRTD
jgi:hypothetical protein